MGIHLLKGADLSTVRIHQGRGIQRDMPRPPDLRQEGYKDQFDFTTLFYFAARAQDGHAHLIGPSFLNFRDHMQAGQYTVVTTGGSRTRIPANDMKWYDGQCQSGVSFPLSPKETCLLEMNLGPLGRHDVPLPGYRGGLFAGKRVAFSMIKYDQLSWVRDWAEFYARAHGSNAILIYNNQAPNYSSRDIADALSGLAEIETVMVVDWPFKYGPQAAGTGLWDSVFCKTGAFQHARHALLGEAASVVNVDIDELIVHPAQESIHVAVERADFPYLRIGGIWACRSAADPSPPECLSARRHRHFLHRSSIMPRKCAPKWALVPSACPPESQWVTHTVRNWAGLPSEHSEFCFRHFRDLNSGWKGKRSSLPRKQFLDDEAIAIYSTIDWVQAGDAR
ncbi:hypothetical protein [Kordiimonas sp.]|uniref:hypothetical protein n=1 Tax=Kordiimonas sp. TaxID=1970157 RepID=UPI003A90AC56